VFKARDSMEKGCVVVGRDLELQVKKSMQLYQMKSIYLVGRVKVE